MRETPFDEIWKISEVLQKLRTLDHSWRGCGTCRYKLGHCGGCRARAAFYHEGDYMAEEPWCSPRRRADDSWMNSNNEA